MIRRMNYPAKTTLTLGAIPAALVFYSLAVAAGVARFDALPAYRLPATAALAAAFGGLALALRIAAPRLAAQPASRRLSFATPFGRLSLWILGGLFVLFAGGAFVSLASAGDACTAWPWCSDALLPTSLAGWLNFAHRLVVGALGAAVAVWFVQAWRTQRSQPVALSAVTAAAVLYFAQALLGARMAVDYSIAMRVLHEATSAAVWTAAVIAVLAVGWAGRSAEQEQVEANIFRQRAARRMAFDLLLLTKPIVAVLLLVTTYAGMVIAAGEWPAASLTAATLLGGFLAAGGSGAVNQYLDRRDDAQMQRTQKRPIPSGRLTPGEGLAFGVGSTLAAFYLLVGLVNVTAALLAMAGFVYYVFVYSILLKKATVQNIVIGGGAGAIPPLVGWAAVTGSLSLPAWLLFTIVFLWTPPHFWALALVRRNDYARAGVPMLPVVRGEMETRRQIWWYSLALVGYTWALPLLGLGGKVYLGLSGALGLWLLSAAWKVFRVEGNKVAWKMYRYSSMYLAFLFAALVADALVG